MNYFIVDEILIQMTGDIMAFQGPVIVGAVPAHDSRNSHAKLMFGDLKVNRKGAPRQDNPAATRIKKKGKPPRSVEPISIPNSDDGASEAAKQHIVEVISIPDSDDGPNKAAKQHTKARATPALHVHDAVESDLAAKKKTSRRQLQVVIMRPVRSSSKRKVVDDSDEEPQDLSSPLGSTYEPEDAGKAAENNTNEEIEIELPPFETLKGDGSAHTSKKRVVLKGKHKVTQGVAGPRKRACIASKCIIESSDEEAGQDAMKAKCSPVGVPILRAARFDTPLQPATEESCKTVSDTSINPHDTASVNLDTEIALGAAPALPATVPSAPVVNPTTLPDAQITPMTTASVLPATVALTLVINPTTLPDTQIAPMMTASVLPATVASTLVVNPTPQPDTQIAPRVTASALPPTFVSVPVVNPTTQPVPSTPPSIHTVPSLQSDLTVGPQPRHERPRPRIITKANLPPTNEDPDNAFSLRKRNQHNRSVAVDDGMPSALSVNLLAAEEGRATNSDQRSEHHALSAQVPSGPQQDCPADTPELMLAPRHVPSYENGPQAPHYPPARDLPNLLPGMGAPVGGVRDMHLLQQDGTLAGYNERMLMNTGWYGPARFHGYPGNFPPMAGPYPQWGGYPELENARAPAAAAPSQPDLQLHGGYTGNVPAYNSYYYRGQPPPHFHPPPALYNGFLDGTVPGIVQPSIPTTNQPNTSAQHIADSRMEHLPGGK